MVKDIDLRVEWSNGVQDSRSKAYPNCVYQFMQRSIRAREQGFYCVALRFSEKKVLFLRIDGEESLSLPQFPPFKYRRARP